MLANLITEGDKKNMHLDLSVRDMRKFTTHYEQLHNREKKLIQEGYPEQHLGYAKSPYGTLIKVFVKRAEQVSLRSRSQNLMPKVTIDTLDSASSAKTGTISIRPKVNSVQKAMLDKVINNSVEEIQKVSMRNKYQQTKLIELEDNFTQTIPETDDKVTVEETILIAEGPQVESEEEIVNIQSQPKE